MKRYIIGKKHASKHGYSRIVGFKVMESDVSDWNHAQRDGVNLILLQVPEHPSSGRWYIAEDDLVPLTNAGNAYLLSKEAPK